MHNSSSLFPVAAPPPFLLITHSSSCHCFIRPHLCYSSNRLPFSNVNGVATIFVQRHRRVPTPLWCLPRNPSPWQFRFTSLAFRSRAIFSFWVCTRWPSIQVLLTTIAVFINLFSLPVSWSPLRVSFFYFVLNFEFFL